MELTQNEKLTLTLSAAALAVSFVSTYFQFCHISERVSVSVVAFKADVPKETAAFEANLAYVNNGNREVVVTEADFQAREASIITEPGTFPMTLRPQEIRIVTTRGTITCSQCTGRSAYELPLLLKYQIIGAKGRVDSTSVMGKLFISSRVIDGYETVVRPLDLL